MNTRSLPYDESSKQSILDYAKKLENSTLRKSCVFSENKEDEANKGQWGQLVERFYFFIPTNSSPYPDFPKAGLELKTGYLKILKKDGSFSNGEGKLNLSMINASIIDEHFENSSFMKKNKSLLLIFHYKKGIKEPLDYKVKLVGHYQFPDDDLVVIKADWNMIRTKLKNNQELHQGDGNYIDCMSKAGKHCFGIKGEYLKHILHEISTGKKEIFGKKLLKKKNKDIISIEDEVKNFLKPYFGKSLEQLSEEFDIKIGRDKSRYSNFITKFLKRLFEVKNLEDIDEFNKAGISLKTIRVYHDYMPTQDVSFKAFEFIDVYGESWEDSSFFNIFQKKFIFVVFKEYRKSFVLSEVKFWRIEENDLKEIYHLWKHTRNVIKSGKIVKEIKGKTRFTNFQNSIGTTVAHIRTHATKTSVTYPLPVKDILTGAREFTRHSIYMNKKYVKGIIKS